MPTWIFCPKCKKFKVATQHHILPKRFFGPNGKTFLLCRECHDDLEKLIPRYQKKKRGWYAWILDFFLNND